MSGVFFMPKINTYLFGTKMLYTIYMGNLFNLIKLYEA